MSIERIYRITNGTASRLVRAASPAQALSHVARTTYKVNVATQDDLVELVGQGVTVEHPSDAPPPEPTTEPLISSLT